MGTRQLFIGLMSGTSLDGIDAVLLSADDNQFELIDTLEYSLPPILRKAIHDLCLPGSDEISRLGKADRELAMCYADACTTLLKNNALTADQITAIGCHGQTVRHSPNTETAFTLQIGDPNTLAMLTRITTVADFRRRDIAAGGQGAPLAPLFHEAFFASDKHNRAIINIGGIANISILSTKNDLLGYDSGPGNVLMDEWINEQEGKPYDHQGQWASTGTIDQALLNRLMAEPFFTSPHPKSTGRELFNLSWLQQHLNGGENPADVQATLLELTAQSIATEIKNANAPIQAAYLCGGGTYNTQLALRIETLIHPTVLATTKVLGIEPEWVEAAGFAWLAKQTLEAKPAKTKTVTGAKEDQILGAIFHA